MSALREQNHAEDRAVPDGSGRVIQKGNPESSVRVGHNTDCERASTDLLVIKAATPSLHAKGVAVPLRAPKTRVVVQLLTENPTWPTVQIANSADCSTHFVRSVRSRLFRNTLTLPPRATGRTCAVCGAEVFRPRISLCSPECSYKKRITSYCASTCSIRVRRLVIDDLRSHATQRKVHVCELARRIIETVVECNMVDAVLDDGE